MPHFLLTTFGSLGDLHPYIAVGLGLRERGHLVTVATSDEYRAKVEGEGLNFHPVRPEILGLRHDPEVMARAYHPRTGSEYVIRSMILPYLEQSYEDLMGIAREADLMVGHPIAFATPIIAEKLGKRWISGGTTTIRFYFRFGSAVFFRISVFGAATRLGARFLGAVSQTGPAHGPKVGRAD